MERQTPHDKLTFMAISDKCVLFSVEPALSGALLKLTTSRLISSEHCVVQLQGCLMKKRTPGDTGLKEFVS